MLSPVKVLKTKQSRMYSHFFKRFFDFCITFCALVVLSPFMLVFVIILHFARRVLYPGQARKGCPDIQGGKVQDDDG